MSKPTINQYQDTLDVRDIIARVEELREERAALEQAKDDAVAAAEANDARDEDTTPRNENAETELAEAWRQFDEWNESNNAEDLHHLEALLSDLAGNGGDEQWEGAWYPVTLIRDDYFTRYAQELVEDIGDLPNGLPSYIEVDWEATARNIRMDYTFTEFHGVTYWFR
jgi:hypothetical protein